LTFGGTVDAVKFERIVTLAARSDSLWIATLNGDELEPVGSFINKWKIPKGEEGILTVSLKQSTRSTWLLLAGFSMVSALLVLAPRRRNTYRDEWLVVS
jgi:hypothetical protein